MTKRTDFKKVYERLGVFYTRSHEGESAFARRRAVVEHIQGGRVLEIGCAEGFMTREIANKKVDLIAGDISINYIKRAKESFPAAKYVVMDAAHLPFKEGAFHTVLLSDVLEHVPEPFSVLEEVHRVLNEDPSGSLLLVVPNLLSVSNILGHFFRMYGKYSNIYDGHINFYDYGSILQLFNKTGFSSVLLCAPYFKLAGLDFILRWPGLRKTLQRHFPQFAHEILVVATRKQKKVYWERIGSNLT